jgi:hypothetical protein
LAWLLLLAEAAPLLLLSLPSLPLLLLPPLPLLLLLLLSRTGTHLLEAREAIQEAGPASSAPAPGLKEDDGWW